eukprot:COSAG05_NODE_168_length_15164_cov_8.323734_10_plen_96_part_00
MQPKKVAGVVAIAVRPYSRCAVGPVRTNRTNVAEVKGVTQRGGIPKDEVTSYIHAIWVNFYGTATRSYRSNLRHIIDSQALHVRVRFHIIGNMRI